MQVKKRNGKIENFDVFKIATAIYKARLDAGYQQDLVKCVKEAKNIVNEITNNEIIDIETIQDEIEKYFIKNDDIEVFKLFTFYREKRRQDRANPWANNDERQDLILQKYLLKGETKKQFLDRISFGRTDLLKIFRKREGIWGGRNLFAIGRSGNITGSNCFIKNTNVLTKDGYKNIEDILVGEKVFTHDGSYQIVNAIMKNFHEKELIKLNSLYFNKEIITTPNHEFLTQEGWVQAKDLSVHKRTSKKSPHFMKFKKLNLNEPKSIEIDIIDILDNIIGENFILKSINDTQYQPKIKQNNKGTLCFTKSTIKPINKKIIIDEKLAYVLGRYAGDGSITKRKNTKHNLYSIFQIVGNEKEIDILNYCADIIEEKFGIEIKRQKTSGIQKTYIIRTDSIVVAEFFNYYVGHSFDKKTIHKDLMSFPSFLYGVFDSDGSINKKCVGSIVMNNNKIIKQLKEMADSFGLPTYITKKVNSIKKYGDYPMLIIPKNSMSLIINKINKKYKDDRIKNCISTKRGTVRIIDNKTYIQLSSKEYIKGNVDVYNISVKVNHDYLVDNIHVHNCYTAVDPKDNLEDIYRTAYEIAKTYSYGGGQGMNLSNLRPKGARVNNSSNTTPGIMTFAELYSFITLNTQQENRRGALMLMLNIDHPDVIDFIISKLDLSKIAGANISLAVTNDFMKAYENNEDWNLTFETPYEMIVKTVNARELMHLISYAAHTIGDPGFIYIDNVNNYHLLSEYDEVEFTSTNPCGEQPLVGSGSCNLGSINLNAFVRKEFTEEAYFDSGRFIEVVKSMVSGLDKLLDMMGDRHALKSQRDHVKEWREVGLTY